MTLIRHIYTILAAVVTAALFGSCADDMLDSGIPGQYPEGNTDVQFVMDYEPFSGTGGASRGVNGKTMDVLDDLCIVAYDKAGNLMEGFPMEITKSGNGLAIKDVNRTDSDASNGASAEKRTKQASFTANIPYGNYYLYAVSNLGSRDSEGNLTLSTAGYLASDEVADKIATREGFLNMQARWNEDNPYDNFQMLGYFYNPGKDDKKPFTSPTANDVTVSIAAPQVKIHSWLRRCASKVTIDFDASGLDDYVTIYVRRATIHDIPRTCAIGRPNKPGDIDELYTYKDDKYLPTRLNAGNTIVYGEGDDHTAWPKLTKSTPDFLDNPHDEDAESLFLYENMQGISTDPKNKLQQPNNDGTVVGSTEVKDNMPYGSYIEVEAYYNYYSKVEHHEGKIIYRFMLGKDEINNFDVERNYHIKLTMRVRGRGNDVDWHIVYDRTSGFEWKDPYYVSYLYDQSSTVHFNFTPDAGEEVDRIEAEIIGNNWWPDNTDDGVDTDTRNLQKPFKSDLNYLVNSDYEFKNVYGNDVPAQMRSRAKYLGNGFLSLYHTDDVLLRYEDVTGITYNANTWTEQPYADSLNDYWFYGASKKARKDKNGNGLDQSRRTYYPRPKDEAATDSKYQESLTDDRLEDYNMEVNEDKSVRVNIPVFTRPKNLVKETAYSGNNPYDGSERTAFILFKVYYKSNTDGKPDAEQIMRVVQVRRLTNPKGIYRRAGNNENFNVELMHLEKPADTYFRSFESDGPWMAEVINGTNFINLNGRSTVKGNDGTPIKFQVRFNKMNAGDKVRTAIIRVRYHNYTCVHLIFVRQGYGSLAISEDGIEWHATNLIHAGLEAQDPRDEGSLFRFGNLDDPIDVYSNGRPTDMWPYGNELPERDDYHSWFTPTSLHLADTSSATGELLRDGNGQLVTKKWTDIKGHVDEEAYDAMDKLGVPTMAQYTTLFGSVADKRSSVKHAFGILYADGATCVQSSLEQAWNYNRHDGDRTRGIRGMFVYHWDGKTNNGSNLNGANVFFPIGRSGFGHRRSNDFTDGNPANSVNGTLRYCAGRSDFMPTAARKYFPLFFDLFRREGAIYWGKQPQWVKDVTETDYNTLGLDINYYTFDVNTLPLSNLQHCQQWNGCDHPECIDACFIRAIGHTTAPRRPQ